MTLSNEEMVKFDDVFLGILQHCGKIEPFLDSIFYFLSRRTDFFQLMHSKDDKLGFPPGVAEKMLIKIFEKHQQNILKNDHKYMEWKQKKKSLSTAGASNVGVNIAEKKQTKKVETAVEDNIITPNNVPEHVQEVEISTQSQHPPKNDPPQLESATSLTSSDTFNGGTADHYSWSQTINDVDIKIAVPKEIKKSKDLSIEIRPDSISVKLRNDPPQGSGLESRLLMEGTFSNKIRCDESLWSLLPSQYISICLEKYEPKWWTRVLEADAEIDKQQIDTTQQVADFDPQTQSDIRKVMYDQQQKMMGKPTSEEQKTHDLLKKAWDAEGSPFKGTPFDPSRVNMGGENSPMPPIENTP